MMMQVYYSNNFIKIIKTSVSLNSFSKVARNCIIIWYYYLMRLIHIRLKLSSMEWSMCLKRLNESILLMDYRCIRINQHHIMRLIRNNPLRVALQLKFMPQMIDNFIFSTTFLFQCTYLIFQSYFFVKYSAVIIIYIILHILIMHCRLLYERLAPFDVFLY